MVLLLPSQEETTAVDAVQDTTDHLGQQEDAAATELPGLHTDAAAAATKYS